MFCRKCGKELNDGTRFCESCGAPQEQAQQEQAQQEQAQQEQAQQEQAQQEQAQQNQQNPAPQYNQQQYNQQSNTQDNKIMNILAYWLFFLPLVSSPVTQEGKFHANQGLLLLLTSIAGSIVISILGAIIFAISWSLAFFTSLLWFAWGIAMIALVIIGMMNANKGEQKPLPVIGKLFTIIK